MLPPITDEVDLKILSALQANARTSNAEIARQIGLAPSAVLEIIRRLEDRGVIRGYEARISPRSLGYGLLAFVFVRTSFVDSDEAARRISSVPGVMEIHNVAGEDCLLVKLRASDTEAVSRVLRDDFGKIPGIISTRTTIVLETELETGTLPIFAAGSHD